MITKKSELHSFPSNQIDGFYWVINVIDDLEKFCLDNQLEQSAELLREVRNDILPEIQAKARRSNTLQ